MEFGDLHFAFKAPHISLYITCDFAVVANCTFGSNGVITVRVQFIPFPWTYCVVAVLNRCAPTISLVHKLKLLCIFYLLLSLGTPSHFLQLAARVPFDYMSSQSLAPKKNMKRVTVVPLFKMTKKAYLREQTCTKRWNI